VDADVKLWFFALGVPLLFSASSVSRAEDSSFQRCKAATYQRQLQRLTSPNEYSLVTLKGADGELRRIVLYSDVARPTLAGLGVPMAVTRSVNEYPAVLKEAEAKALASTVVYVPRPLSKLRIGASAEGISCLWAGVVSPKHSEGFWPRNISLRELLARVFREVRPSSDTSPGLYVLPMDTASTVDCNDIAALLECDIGVGRGEGFTSLVVVTPPEPRT
jgi:hypothetical protein